LLLVVPTGEIEVTCAPSSTPLSASGVTVAAFPTFSLLTSDSLNATVIVIVRVLTISANGELELPDDEEDELEVVEPRLPAVAPEEPVVGDADEAEVPLELDVPDADALPVVPADTVSPGDTLARDTIVPLFGAYSLVLLSAACAVSTFACALSTAAWAEAMLAAEVVVLEVVLDPPLVEPAPDVALEPVLEPVLVDEPDSALLS
jgi:hypothetical protein